MKKYFFSSAAYVAIVALTLFVSCSKKKDPQPEVVEPTPVEKPIPIPVFMGNTNNMVNDTSRVSMARKLMDYILSSNTKGVKIDTANLNNRYLNKNNIFFDPTLNAKTNIDIAQAVNPVYKDSIPSYFNRIANASKSTQDASNGVAGVLKDGPNIYGKLLDEKGFAIDELIEKALMGYYQVYQLHNYLSEASVNSMDSAANLKNWDMAFAQLGIPLDYGNKDYYYSIKLWGKYLKINDQRLGGNISKILNAFVSGRQAVIDKNKTNVTSNANIIRGELERATAGMVLTSLNNVKYYNNSANFSLQDKNRWLTQAFGFLHVLQNFPNKKISDTQLNGFMNRLNQNNWTFAMTEVDALLSEFSGIYGFNTSVYIEQK